MKRQKKILLIGELYSDNLGDGIICNTVKNILKNNDIQMIDLSGKNDYCKKNQNFVFSKKNEYKTFIKEKIKKMLKKKNISIKEKKLDIIFNRFKSKFEQKLTNYKPDVIIFAGGQLLMNCFLKPLEYIIEYANKNNIPVIINACGIGNIYGKNEKEKLKKILNAQSIKYISVRDGYEILNKLNLNKKIVETYDTVIICNDFFEPITNKTNKIGLGIMISHTISVNQQINFWKKIILQLEKQNEEWEIFCNGSVEDYEFAKHILKKLNLDEKKYLSKRPLIPIDLINQINSYKKIISMRLHSLIIAYAYNIPAIAISWDKKVTTFYNKIGKKELCFNIKSNTNEIIKTCLNTKNTIKNKDRIREDIYISIKKVVEIINKI